MTMASVGALDIRGQIVGHVELGYTTLAKAEYHLTVPPRHEDIIYRVVTRIVDDPNSSIYPLYQAVVMVETCVHHKAFAASGVYNSPGAALSDLLHVTSEMVGSLFNIGLIEPPPRVDNDVPGLSWWDKRPTMG